METVIASLRCLRLLKRYVRRVIQIVLLESFNTWGHCLFMSAEAALKSRGCDAKKIKKSEGNRDDKEKTTPLLSLRRDTTQQQKKRKERGERKKKKRWVTHSTKGTERRTISISQFLVEYNPRPLPPSPVPSPLFSLVVSSLTIVSLARLLSLKRPKPLPREVRWGGKNTYVYYGPHNPRLFS